jgi:hypothetical protein
VTANYVKGNFYIQPHSNSYGLSHNLSQCGFHSGLSEKKNGKKTIHLCFQGPLVLTPAPYLASQCHLHGTPAQVPALVEDQDSATQQI